MPLLAAQSGNSPTAVVQPKRDVKKYDPDIIYRVTGSGAITRGVCVCVCVRIFGDDGEYLTTTTAVGPAPRAMKKRAQAGAFLLCDQTHERQDVDDDARLLP
jgi:hypothetical protein